MQLGPDFRSGLAVPGGMTLPACNVGVVADGVCGRTQRWMDEQ
jgi:hypothetical protein